MIRNKLSALLMAAAICGAGARLVAQMEKRDTELYDRAAFLAQVPAVDTTAPDLVLADVDGKPWALSSLKGRIVVVIKGGYT